MNVFPSYRDANLATQLWIAARFMESVSLLLFSILSGRFIRTGPVLLAYRTVTAMLLLSLFVWPVFPVCFVEGAGLTIFKKLAEYVICGVLAAAVLLLWRKKQRFDRDVFRLLTGAMLVTMAGELCFTFYVSVYGFSNLVGHYCKILSFFLVYMALIRSGLSRPYAVLFQDLKQSEENYRFLVENAPISIMGFDARGVVTYVNPSHLKTFGAGKHGADFFVGKKIHDLPGIVKAGISHEIMKVLEGRTVTMANVRFPEFSGGHPGYQNIKAVPFFQDGRVTGGLLLREDATESRNRERKFEAAFQRTPLMMGISEIEDGAYLEINDTFERITGYARAEVVGKCAVDLGLISKEDRDRLKQAVVEHGHMEAQEFSMRTKSGELRTCLLWGETIEVEGRGRLLSMINDVTDRKQAESELRKLAAAMEQVVEAIVITDANGGVQYVNPAFESITGYPAHEAVKMNLRRLEDPEKENTGLDEIFRDISSGHIWKGRMSCRNRAGAAFIAEGSAAPVKGDQGTGGICVFVLRDITRDLKLEEQVLQSQKMEAIGALAGGIAHDFNNILFPMTGYAEILHDDLPLDSPLQDSVMQILKASRRAKGLVAQILAFSRGSEQQKKAVRVQSILKEVLKLARAGFPATIHISEDIDASCPPILADPVQIHQVAMNLVTNALHAMEENGGTLSLLLKRHSLNERDRHPGLPSAHCVQLSVTDTGRGIEPAVLDRIFEPYFTTKEKGKGTGLGLSVVHGIIKSHDGDIRVESTLGRGATFSVFLPCLAEERDEQGPAEKTAVIGGNEHILLVDDEPEVLKLEIVMLERLGYRVTARNGSVEALNTFKSRPDHYDLVITDMTMPSMTGTELCAHLLNINPDLPVIIVTGFSEKIDAGRAKTVGASGFLLKPVIMSLLAEEIRRALKD